MIRVHSDKWLGLTESKSTIVDDFRSLFRQWLAATDKAEGRQLLTAKDKRAIRDEARWGIRWLNEMERAIDLGLPKAAIECAARLHEIHARLIEYIDEIPAHNLIAPLAIHGEKIQNQRIGGGQKTADQEKAEKALRTAEIQAEYRKRFAGRKKDWAAGQLAKHFGGRYGFSKDLIEEAISTKALQIALPA